MTMFLLGEKCRRKYDTCFKFLALPEDAWEKTDVVDGDYGMIIKMARLQKRKQRKSMQRLKFKRSFEEIF